MKKIIAGTLLLAMLAACTDAPVKRETISLNGTWQITDGLRDVLPQKFDRTIPVPGLIRWLNLHLQIPLPGYPTVMW